MRGEGGRLGQGGGILIQVNPLNPLWIHHCVCCPSVYAQGVCQHLTLIIYYPNICFSVLNEMQN